MRLTVALAVSVAAAVSAAGSLCPSDNVVDLSVDDVQSLLQDWRLGKAFGEQFKEQEIDGYALTFLAKSTVATDAYPNAQPFQWNILWERLSDCDIGSAARKSASTDEADEATAATRRKLASQSTSGIHIKKDNAGVLFGEEADVAFMRTGAKSMTISGNIHFEDNCTFGSGAVGASSSSSCDCELVQELADWREQIDDYFRRFFGLEADVADVWNNTDALTITNCNQASLDGYYWIDPGTVDPFMAHCSIDADDNWWMKIAYFNGLYTPTSLAIGDFYGDLNNETFKLSDAQINAVIESDSTFGHTYRVHGHNEWSDLNYYVMTDEPFDDEARGFGAPGDLSFYVHSEGSTPSANDWEVYYNDNLDSIGLSYIDNDGDRYFADHSSTINCYPLSTSTTRCFSSGSSADDHDQIDIVTLSLNVGSLNNVSPFPVIDNRPTVLNCNEADEDGYYNIDTGSTDTFLAYCSIDNDDNRWMHLMYQNDDYTPSFKASSEAYMEDFGLAYKLSDEQINAVIGTDSTFGHSYRIHSHDEWTDKDYFLMTYNEFDDEARGYNIPMDESWYVHSEGNLPSDNDWEVYANDNPDSIGLSYINNDGDRYFCDHSYTWNCYPLGTDDTRCWSSGSSANDHDQIDTFTMALHLGTLNNVADDAYPFPDLTSLGTVTNCNDATEEGYYMIDPGTVDPFMAKCSIDNDDNHWLEIMYQVDDYTPNSAATSTFYAEHWDKPYKLSDEQINAVINTEADTPHTYKIHSHDEWTDLDYFLMTTNSFDDEARGFNVPIDESWYWHSEGYLPSTNDWEQYSRDNPDSLGLSYISNDGDRYFCDHSYDINCYPLGTSDTRCWSSGSSADDHDQIDTFTMSLNVGTLNNIDSYPDFSSR